jgi:sugar (pentulose or hexulose) kinase
MLCGKIDAEITDMSGTNLMNVRDVGYDRELLAAFGLEAMMDKLSPIVGSTEICGGVTREAAAKTGLLEGTPVAAGLFDIDAMAIATGVVDESKLSSPASPSSSAPPAARNGPSSSGSTWPTTCSSGCRIDSSCGRFPRPCEASSSATARCSLQSGS